MQLAGIATDVKPESVMGNLKMTLTDKQNDNFKTIFNLFDKFDFGDYRFDNSIFDKLDDNYSNSFWTWNSFSEY